MDLDRRTLLGLLPLTLVACAAKARPPEIHVYKSPTCGCCGGWAEHLRQNGFQVTVQDTDDLEPMAKRLNIPDALRSCHTGLVEGYFVEGHVPAADIRKLLATRPSVAGLAVPGMPAGSPGMEGPPPEPFRTLLVDRANKVTVFASH